MASVCISIENNTAMTQFHRALNQAGSVASEMIEVKTQIGENGIVKIVKTECPWAIAVFRSIGQMGRRA